MKILVLDHSQVTELLEMSECIAVMQDALAALARGEMHQPLRTATVPKGAGGVLGLMPAYSYGPPPLFALKAVCIFPGNSAKGLDSHQGAVLLFSGETGQLLSMMDASAITSIRTAAVSAVATQLLARDDAGELALVGAGVQARAHLLAMACSRKIRRARVASLHPDRVSAFVEEMSPKVDFPVVPAASVEEAVKGADLIATTTTSRDPVLRREWISPGAHLNVIGSSVRTCREIDAETMASVRLFVDRRESTLNESGEYLFAAQEGAINPDHIVAEIGELLIGEKQGRTQAGQVTLFKSLGLAIEDLASARHLYDKAHKTNQGQWVEF
ncbi:MAG TPA: ornithine cyclodeaminase family protein [Blastocatellia bacterium]|nr:ornithine cyclodeaminase family protein [Blastocatellia bacterium]